jgi:hypothetical protein
LAKLVASLANGFISHDHATFQQEFFAIAKAETKAKVQPDRVADHAIPGEKA